MNPFTKVANVKDSPGLMKGEPEGLVPRSCSHPAFIFSQLRNQVSFAIKFLFSPFDIGSPCTSSDAELTRLLNS